MRQFTTLLVLLGFSLSLQAQDCERIVPLPSTKAFLSEFSESTPGQRSEQTEEKLSTYVLEALADFNTETLGDEFYLEFTINNKGEFIKLLTDDAALTAHLELNLPNLNSFVPASYRNAPVCSRLGFSISTTLLQPPNEVSTSSEPDFYRVVEYMPLFHSGLCPEEPYAEAKICAEQKMLETIYGNIRYPLAAREAGTEGMTVVSFLIDENGHTSDHELVRDLGNGTGEEALRVVRDFLLQWRPGIRDGQAVNVRFNLPVKFKL